MRWEARGVAVDPPHTPAAVTVDGQSFESSVQSKFRDDLVQPVQPLDTYEVVVPKTLAKRTANIQS